MRLAMMMAMQAVAGPPLPADMRPVKPAPAPDAPKATCGEPDADGTIVICGRPVNANRLRPVDETRYAEKPIRARTTIGKVGVSGEAEQGSLPNGMSSPRAMVKLKVPF